MDGTTKMDYYDPFGAVITFSDETARRANEEFVQKLATVLEDYQNIWKKYLDLVETQKESSKNSTIIEADGKNDNWVNQIPDSTLIRKETTNFKITNPVSRDNSNEDFNSSVDLFSSSNVNMNLNSKANSYTIEIPEISTCDFKSDVEDVTFEDMEQGKRKSPLKNFLTSPVFKSRQSSSKKKQQHLNKTHKKLSQSSFNESVIKEDLVKPLQSIENSTRTYSTLSISTACNVKTEYLSNGRKCKQTKLVFKPIKSKPNQSFCNEGSESRRIEAENSFFNKSNEVEAEKSPFKESKKIEAEKSLFNESKKIEAQKSLFNESKKIEAQRSLFNDSKKIEAQKSHSNEWRNIEAEKSLFNESRENLDETKSHFVDVSPQSTRKRPKVPKKKNNFDILSTKNEKSWNWAVRDIPEIGKSKENSMRDQWSPSKKRFMESMVDDATFFAEAEAEAELEEKKKESDDPETIDLDANVFREVKKQKSSVARDLVDSFDMIPEKKKRSPEFAYKGRPVRNKHERAKLTGWNCWECEQYYKNLGLSEEELQKRMNKCSRHRAKYNEHPESPEGYWNPVFPQTLGSSSYAQD